MRTPSLVAITMVSVILLAGCGASIPRTSIEAENKNPLTAAKYGRDLAETLTNLIIRKDPQADQPGMRDVIQREIAKAKSITSDGEMLQDLGTHGAFTAVKEEVLGRALLLNRSLYFDPTFETKPGPDLHVYVSTITDPRGTAFPDNTAADLGQIQTVLGSQQYTVPARTDDKTYGCVVLWDKTLNRIFGFAQLSKTY